jgi:MFS family permease
MAILSLGRWKRGMLLILGSLMSGVGLVLVAAFPYYLAAVGIMVLLGLGDSARRSLNQTLIIEVVDDRYRGRVMSVFMMNFGLMPLGVLPAGFLMESLGEEATIAILGAGMLAVATMVLVTQKRLRELA